MMVFYLSRTGMGGPERGVRERGGERGVTIYQATTGSNNPSLSPPLSDPSLSDPSLSLSLPLSLTPLSGPKPYSVWGGPGVAAAPPGRSINHRSWGVRRVRGVSGGGSPPGGTE